MSDKYLVKCTDPIAGSKSYCILFAAINDKYCTFEQSGRATRFGVLVTLDQHKVLSGLVCQKTEKWYRVDNNLPATFEPL